ncbi:MAG TPA: efflux RND transporter permease subunit [Allosphingosinicella sp.]|nr:efflux RND transporter permease subunit [Allosphingosinicella sp.]
MRSGPLSGLSHWAIAHERWIWLLFGLLLALGCASYSQLPVKRFPTVKLPAVAVTVSAGKADPAEVERKVASRTEIAVGTLPGIHRIWTQIGTGQSVTIAQFESRLSGQPLTKRVEAAISQLRLESSGRRISVRRLEIDSAPMLSYAITSAIGSGPSLSAYVDRILLPRLRALPGVASARRLGGSDQHLEIALSPEAMRAQKVTPLAVRSSLERWRAGAGIATLPALANLRVPSADGRPVPLRQIATIAEAHDVSSHATLDGAPAVGFTVAKSPNADSLEVDDAVADVAAELAERRPDLGFAKIWSSADETRAALGSTQRALAEGMLLAALVVFLFLRDMRATLVVALAMPISLLPTFAVLAASGFSLNMVSLLALTLAVGILVDDAIVEVENIQRLVKAGATPREAAPRGADSIALAVLATTAAIVAVFAPVSFMPGVAGRFFFEFGVTVSAAVIMSLLVARLLTPILAARLLQAGTRKERAPSPPIYRRFLNLALRRPWLTIAGAVAFIVASAALVPLLPTEFQPAADPDFYFVSVVTEPGSRIEDLEALAAQASAIVARRPETKHVLVHLGATAEGGGAAGISAGPPPADPRSARIAVAIDPERAASLPEIRRALRPAFQRLSGATVFAEPPSGAADLQILLSGEDPNALARTRERLLAEMKRLPSVVDPRPLLQGLAQSPEGAAGSPTRNELKPGEYEAALSFATLGEYFGKSWTDEGDLLPVHVRIAAPASDAKIADVPIQRLDGNLASLAAMAPPLDSLRAVILRLDGRRVEGIDADLAPGVASGEAMAAIERLPEMRRLPDGVALAPTGDQEEMQTLFRSMVAAMAGAALAVYATLALLFRSFVLPLIIVSALPLALGGAVIGLLASGSALNLPALIGFLLLLGLAAKNSILLLEHAARRLREGMPVRDSIVEACERRSRAVIMTSVAMAAGMLPAALTLGAGDEFRQPMAFAVIGGLISSTALSLLFVPAVLQAALSGRERRSKSAGLNERRDQ